MALFVCVGHCSITYMHCCVFQFTQVFEFIFLVSIFNFHHCYFCIFVSIFSTIATSALDSESEMVSKTILIVSFCTSPSRLCTNALLKVHISSYKPSI